MCFVFVPYQSPHSKLALELGRIPIQSRLQFAECSRLYLVCVLQLSNPLRLLLLEPSNLSLDLHALLVLLVNATDQVLSLLQPFLLFLHHAHLHCLVLLVPDHLLHSLGLELLCAFLDIDHLLVLLSLSFETFSLTIVFLGLCHLLVADSLLLVQTVLLVAHLQLVLLLLSLLGQSHLLVLSLGIALSDIDNVVGLLLGLLNFFPGL